MAITGIQPEVEAPLSIQAENIVEGRFLLEGEGDALLIGRGLADLLDVGVGDRVTLTGRSKNESMRQRTMTIVGVYDLGMPDIEKGDGLYHAARGAACSTTCGIRPLR